MQRELFGPPPEGLHPTTPTPEALRRLVMGIAGTHLIDRFRFWIVGSVLRKLDRAPDLDLLITRRDERRISIAEVEQALYEVHRIGRYESCIHLDGFFIARGELLGGNLSSRQLVKTWRLESPHVGAALNRRRFGHARRVGHCLVVQFQAAGNTNYFHKLPSLALSQQVRFLQPGVLIETCLFHFREHPDQTCSWPPGFASGNNPSVAR